MSHFLLLLDSKYILWLQDDYFLVKKLNSKIIYAINKKKRKQPKNNCNVDCIYKRLNS